MNFFLSCLVHDVCYTSFWLINCLILFRYIVKKDAPGLTATKIQNKIGLRIVQNGDIILKKVFVPDEDRLPGVNSFQDTNKVIKRICIKFKSMSSCIFFSFVFNWVKHHC